MFSYKELLEQRAQLDQQINEARQRENAAALTQVRTLIADFHLTVEDVFSSGKTRSSKGQGKTVGLRVAPKYRNPTTGETWTGRGKPPRWIQDQERTQFLIAQ